MLRVPLAWVYGPPSCSRMRFSSSMTWSIHTCCFLLPNSSPLYRSIFCLHSGHGLKSLAMAALASRVNPSLHGGAGPETMGQKPRDRSPKVCYRLSSRNPVGVLRIRPRRVVDQVQSDSTRPAFCEAAVDHVGPAISYPEPKGQVVSRLLGWSVLPIPRV